MNTHGQLGIGVFSDKADTPQKITCLQGLPIRQIAAGGFHSFFVTKSGALFGCGKNTYVSKDALSLLSMQNLP